MENPANKEYLQSFYFGKKVFITGNTGFKGAWLSAILEKLHADVKGYALEPEYENSLYEVIYDRIAANDITADIRDKKRLAREILSFEPDFIFHLAAQPLVRRSYEIPAETFEVNVTGTANLLEAVKHLTKKCTVIVVTTDKVYQNKEQNILYKEEDRLGGYDPYSASKACAELVVSSFRDSFFNTKNYNTHQKAVGSVRAGNVIGGGDRSKDRLIPDIVRSLTESKTIEVRNPKSVRPWQHVLEPLTGYLLFAAMLHNNPADFSKAFNFGPLPEDHLTVESLVKLAIGFWQQGSWKDISNPEDVHEAALLQLDISKAMKELNWHPKLNAMQAIEWTINWYKQPLAAVADYTFSQIQEYLSI
jgi:CDP-glucose 4,6-dehydratase